MSHRKLRQAVGSGCRGRGAPSLDELPHGHTRGTRRPELSPPTPRDTQPGGTGRRSSEPRVKDGCGLAVGGATEKAGPGRGLPQETCGLGISGDKYLMPREKGVNYSWGPAGSWPREVVGQGRVWVSRRARRRVWLPAQE